MEKEYNKNATVYIDASNLKFGTKESGWYLDYSAFYSWLRDKFGAKKVILFLGLLPDKVEYYNYLQNIGYDLFFKPTITSKNGKTKGNVDGELILAIACHYYEDKLKEVVLVSGDGDYHCIVEFLKKKNKIIKIISPNKKYLSFLLRKLNVPIIILDDFKHKLEIKEKAPE